MTYQVQHPNQERSIGELLGELGRETAALVRQEMALAKTEISQKASRIGKDIGFLAAGGAVAYAGLLAVVAAIIIGLAQAGMPWWAAALLVGVLVLGLGGFLAWKGLDALKREDLAPRQTVETLKEDAKWTREQI